LSIDASRWNDEIRRRLRGAGLEPARELEIVRELAQHLDDRYAELLAAGLAPDAAARQTLDDLNDHELMTRDLALVERLEPRGAVLGDARRVSALAGVWQDVRYGLRTLRASPGFTAIATLTLALGIGATTAIFSVVDSMLLRSHRADPDGRVVGLQLTGKRAGDSRQRTYTPSLASMRDWQQRREVFAALAAWSTADLTLLDVDPVERVRAMAVTPELFSVFDARPPATGRLFAAADSGQPLVAISHAAWQRRFGGAADIVGRTIRTVEGTRTIVGVLPLDFPFQPESDFWVPLEDRPAMAYLGWGGNMLGRLRSGVSVRQAEQAMANEPPPPTGSRRDVAIDSGVKVHSFHELEVRYSREMLYSLLGAVACILLIACVNVAGLLIARGSSRSREVAIRASLGARRSRLIRQFLTESLLLAIIGGLSGVALAWWLLETLIGVLPVNVPAGMKPTLDLRLLGLTALIITGTGVGLGLLPAIKLSRTDLSAATKGRAFGSSGSASNRIGRLLVASQVALALVLLAGAGLMVRSLQALLAIDSGFRADGVLVVPVSPVLPDPTAPNKAERIDTFYLAVVDRLSSLPGVSTVGAISTMPFQSFGAGMAMIDTPPKPTVLQVSPRAILPGYLAAMGIVLKAGRDFAAEDRAGRPCVAIVNEWLVKRMSPGMTPIGHRIKLRESTEWCEIVGVVGDVRHAGLEMDPFAELYLPARQTAAPELTFVIRSHDPRSLTAAVAARLTNLPERVLIGRVAPFGRVLGRMTADRENRALLLGIVGGLGLLLACLGIFGLTAYAVARQTREIGVRVALGATPARLVLTVVGSFVPAIAVGIVAGLMGAWAATRLVEQFLFGVEPHDATTLFTVTGLLAMLAVLACYLPARRALRVDPVVALRAE
jgi:putative ABC transport system permease protein